MWGFSLEFRIQTTVSQTKALLALSLMVGNFPFGLGFGVIVLQCGVWGLILGFRKKP